MNTLWLGLKNYCHTANVTYTLNKVAYYGYSQQLTQPDFSKIIHHPLTAEIAALAIKKHEESTTTQLQNELIKAYFKIEPYLSANDTYQNLSSNHRFGDSWVNVNATELVPMLDPQDKDLILEIINIFDQKHLQSPVPFLDQSKFARLAAQYYYDKAKKTPIPSFLASLIWQDPRPTYLALALIYNPKIAQDDPLFFAEYYLTKKEYQQALQLLPLLTNLPLAFKLLLSVPEPIRNTLIEKDSPLAAELAKHYLEKKQYSSAQNVFSNIEKLSPTDAFTIAIKEKNYFEAYKIFKRGEQTTSFPKEDRNALAIVFFNAAEAEYEKGLAFRRKKIWSDAEHHYLSSLTQKKAARSLNPSKKNIEHVFTDQRLYAQLLIDADLDLNKPEDSNVANIQKAITLLRECHSSDKSEQDYHTTTLANGLMRRVDNLREKIALPLKHSDHTYLTEHKVKYQHEIDALIKTLEELIILLTGTSEKNLLLFLGKAHYLLADTHLFFYINDPNINLNYRKAMEAVPENPFYLLRASELFEHERDKLQELGVPKLKSLGFQVIDYYHWSDERWMKRELIIHDIKDIHGEASSNCVTSLLTSSQN